MPSGQAADLSALSESLRLWLLKQLNPGETIVWVGQPDRRRTFRQLLLKWALLTIPANLVWLVLMFFVVRFDTAVVMAPFLLIGIYALFAPVRFLVAPTTLYAITGERALKLRGKQVTTFSGAYIDCVEQTDGWGDLILFFDDSDDCMGDKSIRKDGFDCIPEVRKVARLVQAFQKDRVEL